MISIYYIICIGHALSDLLQNSNKHEYGPKDVLKRYKFS
jgi:hypothetical protein